MAFVVKKKIHGKDYYYLNETKRIKGKVVSKCLAYLGKTKKQADKKARKIIKKIAKEKKRILTFVEHPDVPCHNNFAEYLIRTGVLKRKISGGSLSPEGANAYAILLSIYVTCKLRGISFPKFMKATLIHYIKTGKPMLFKTYENISSLAKAA